ncbi:unnamed protein product, partial [Cylicocyclus nassatus]
FSLIPFPCSFNFQTSVSLRRRCCSSSASSFTNCNPMVVPLANECVARKYYVWLYSTSLQCNNSNDEVEDAVYSLSPYMQSQPIARLNSTTIAKQQVRIFVGCLIINTNVLLLVFLNSRPTMRGRYVFYTLMSIGDIVDGAYFIYPSAIRIGEMAKGTFLGGDTALSLKKVMNDFASGLSLWECASRCYIVFRIFGSELVSLSLLVMAAEKIFAVLSGRAYRLYATPVSRFATAAICLLVCLISILTMFLTSYLDSHTEPQDNKYCGISGSVTEGFAKFHNFLNLSCQIGGFLGSGFAYILTGRLAKQAQLKEMKSIKPILVVSFVSCSVTCSDDIIYILKNFLKLDITESQHDFVVTYSSALFQVSKFVLYILTGEEFRDYLLKMINDKCELEMTTAVTVMGTTRTRAPKVSSSFSADYAPMVVSSENECVARKYNFWLYSTSLQCKSSNNEVEDAIYSLSPYMQSLLITRHTSTTIEKQQIRIFLGCLVVNTNIMLLAFLNSRPAMRSRYVFYTLMSIGDILSGTYLIYPSIMRISEMANGTFLGGVSLWECATRGYMVFSIFGRELVSLSMLFMAAEKVFAVLSIGTYRLYATPVARFVAVAICLLVCLISILIMFLTSYLDSRVEVEDDKYCGISGSVTEDFAYVYKIFNVFCQLHSSQMCLQQNCVEKGFPQDYTLKIGSFLGSGSAYILARRLAKEARSKEIKSIKPILVVYILTNFFKFNITTSQQNFVATYSLALFQVSKFVLYVLTEQDFRDHLRKLISDKCDLETTTAEGTVIRRMRSFCSQRT